jgi:hypothetical protein
MFTPFNELLQERANTTAESDIKNRIPDFKISDVHSHLKEMYKTDPNKATALNNPAGWEMLWKAELAPRSVTPDAVNSGRNVDTDGGRSALRERVRNGEASVHERSSLFEKYL